MKKILLGKDASGRPLWLIPELRQQTHMHLIGGSRSGKSKLLEFIARQDIREGHGLCILDWHGTLINDLMRWCAWHDVGLFGDDRRLILLNPSHPDFVTPFNPFINTSDDPSFISTLVSRYIDATLRPWGVTDTNETPTLERNLRALFHFAVETGEPLPNAAKLLEFGQRELRDYAISVIRDPYIQSQWTQFQEIKTPREWREWTLSTENRLSRFLASRGIMRFMGLPQTIDLVEAMDEQKIILINLGYSDFLHRPEARVFASLFLYQFFDAAMKRANRSIAGTKPKTYVLALDEFQEYVTQDLAAMLDQVLKGGLHILMAHQHLGQFEGNRWLEDSILTNARIRVVFGGQTYESACKLGNEMFLPDLNTRQIKKAYYHTIHLFREETRTSYSHSRGQGRSETIASGHTVSSGMGSASGIGSGLTMGKSTSAGIAVGAPTGSIPDRPDEGVEGWFTDSHGESESSAQSSSEFTSSSEYSSESDSENRSIGESSFESEGETTVPVWVPIPVKELGSESEWSREEKLSKIAEMLKHQPQRHAFIKLGLEKTQPLIVPWVKDFPASAESIWEYQEQVFREQKAIPGPETDHLIASNQQRFLMQAREHLHRDDEASYRGSEIKGRRRR